MIPAAVVSELAVVGPTRIVRALRIGFLSLASTTTITISPVSDWASAGRLPAASAPSNVNRNRTGRTTRLIGRIFSDVAQTRLRSRLQLKRQLRFFPALGSGEFRAQRNLRLETGALADCRRDLTSARDD